MTKRTRTNFYVANGLGKLKDLIYSCYKNGCVGIVYQDEEVLDRVSKALYENGNTIKIKHVSEPEDKFEDYVRYVIGAGDAKVIAKTRLVAQDNLYSFYACDIVPDFFSDGRLMNFSGKRFAEFAYFDTQIFDLKATNLMASGYATLFSLFISLYDIYCVSLHKPFKDSSLEMLIKKIKSFLLYKTDIDLYYQEMIDLIKKSVDWLNKSGEFPIVYRIRYEEKDTWSKNKEFFIAYLLFYLGIIFTKWNFNDMLIPSATPQIMQEDLARFIMCNPLLFEKLFITKEQLSYIAGVYRAMSDGFEDCNLYKALNLITRAGSQTNGLFAQIHKKGIIEGIVNYEEH
ncbi:MAG: hypothetical protein QM214_06405 [Bacillota bacterium]|jgi:hypothetical protein|nr:hypothetical protein [Bacillota bacterium]HHU42994.1 hypothetical protein [Clostridiales bacterium]